jgi:hypothetical protein
MPRQHGMGLPVDGHKPDGVGGEPGGGDQVDLVTGFSGVGSDDRGKRNADRGDANHSATVPKLDRDCNGFPTIARRCYVASPKPVTRPP